MDDQRIPTDPSALWEFYSKGNADPVSLWLDCDTGLVPCAQLLLARLT